MTVAVIYPDIEQTLVTYFNTALEGSDVRVATKHSPPSGPTPTMQLVITVAYGQETGQRVTKDASLTLEVYADSYADASGLALYVESLVRDCVGEEIKRAEVRLGPVRTTEDSGQEKRSLDVALVVKGTTI
jgi:hypothetical protein